MMNYILDNAKELKAEYTYTEICQQPKTWEKVAADVFQKRSDVRKKIEAILNINNARIILTGAGSSAFAGEAIAPILSNKLNRVVEAIPTTDIVSNPDQYLIKEIPTIIVSFARFRKQSRKRSCGKSC